MHPQEVPTIAVADIPDGALLLDVREDEEWAAGRIEGAVHIAMNDVPNHLAYAPEEFAADGPIVVICKMGGRSAYVASWLIQQGVPAVNLDGGMLAWASAHRPMTADGGADPYVA